MIRILLFAPQTQVQPSKGRFRLAGVGDKVRKGSGVRSVGEEIL
jgi:hypothetical protein